MPDLLDLSARMIDSGVADAPTNRVTQELSEVADGVAVVESFSHCVALRTDDGLVAFDSSGAATGRAVVASLRRWSDAPVRTLVYTHGHVDHVGGSPAFLADAEARGHARPEVVAHRAVPQRLARYRRTDAYNLAVNRRQFGWLLGDVIGAGGSFTPAGVLEPDTTYDTTLTLEVGGETVELHHARGETDDHTWAWLPSRRAVCSGDFVIWNFPNAGNPQKVQRYPSEWAAALRAMAAKEPELLLPAHGLPVGGVERVASVLHQTADVLDDLVEQVLALMAQGATLDTVLHTVRVPEAELARPFLRPLYDEPEFVVRNVWRLYGGWWDGNAARLKPAPDADVAAEVAGLAGGAGVLAERAQQLAESGDLRLACQLAEWAGQAAPDDAGVRAVRAAVYEQRHRAESSLMAKGIYRSAALEGS